MSEKSLHARRVPLRRRGVVSLGSNDWMGIKEYAGRFPPFAIAAPKSKRAATIVVERARLLRALTGQDEIVQLSLYKSRDKIYLLELASADAYALVLIAEKEPPEGFGGRSSAKKKLACKAALYARQREAIQANSLQFIIAGS